VLKLRIGVEAGQTWLLWIKRFLQHSWEQWFSRCCPSQWCLSWAWHSSWWRLLQPWCLEDGDITTMFVSSGEQFIDIFTKLLRTKDQSYL